MATRPVVPDMDAPFDAFWHAYNGTYDTLAVNGGRGTGKTRGVSLVQTLKAAHFEEYRIAHVGAIQAQASRCYQYVREYVDRGGPLAPLVFKPRLGDTQFRNGSHIEILAGTANALSGGHPHMMTIDEFDLMKWEIFQHAIGMPHSDDRYQSQILLLSALYRVEGSLNALRRSSSSVRVMRWSVFDAMEPCDGTDGRPLCEDAMAVHNGGAPTNPPRCPLWNDCQGMAQYAEGHKKRRDVIAEFELTDEFTWRTQYLSQDAQRAGVVYEHFRPEESDDGTTNVSKEAEYDPERDVLWGMDQGYEDPSVCLYMQQKGEELHVFDEVYVRHMAVDQFLDCVHQPAGLEGRGGETWFRRVPGEEVRGPYKKPSRVAPDPSAIDMTIQIRRRLLGGMGVFTRRQRILDGVNVIRRLVRTNNGVRRLKIHPRCENLIRELTYLRLEQIAPGVWGDDPASNDDGKNPDHACDSLRYLCWNMYGRPQPAVARAYGAGQ